MSEVSSVEGAAAFQAAQTQIQVAVELVKKSLEVQTEAMEKLLASMGVGTKLDVEA